MHPNPLFKLDVYSHYVKITNPSPRIEGLLRYYCHRLTSRIFVKERGKFISKPDKLYGFRKYNGAEYRFHRNSWNDLKNYLSSNLVEEHLYQVTHHLPYRGVDVSLPIREGFAPRDYQEPAVDYIVEVNDNPSKLVAIYTGGGKTSVALFALSRLGKRFIIIIKPGYIEKWFGDIQNFMSISSKDILVVQGGDQLRGLIQMADEGTMHAKVIIMSNRTYLNYVKAYETDPDGLEAQSYECHPENLFEKLGVGVRLIDEVHQEFHGNFKMDLYTNLPVAISLSATLINYNPFMEKVYDIAYPKSKRFDSVKMHKYIKVYPVSYSFKEPSKIRLTEYGSNNYSHVAFEKSILNRPHVLRPYMGMIGYLVDISYIRDYYPGDKILIFAATIKLCTELTNYFKARYPDKDVRRYVEDDDYDNIINGEITVTTLLSGGTAVDIPDLRVVINTVNVDSAQSNKQGMGRLRDLKTRDVKYYYTHCEQFEKHSTYSERRQNLIRDSVASIKPLAYPFSI